MKRTGINLLDLRQGQLHLFPVHDAVLSVERVALKVDRLQLVLVGELALELGERRQLVIRRPHLLQRAQMREPAEVLNCVVGHVDDA